MIDADTIDALLPQTQCTKCGFGGCRPYAQAIAAGQAAINRCPPGGQATIARVARLLGREPLPLDPTCGIERPRRVAWIDPALCIGCTRCIQACPVDAIIGASRRMHTVIAALCTGCELCVAPCPVDCIPMRDLAPTGAACGAESCTAPPWRDEDADAARARYRARNARLARRRAERDTRLAQRADQPPPEAAAARGSTDETGSPRDGADPAAQRRRAVIEAALRRARERADRS